MSSAFDQYESEFQSIVAQMKNHIHIYTTTATSNTKKIVKVGADSHISNTIANFAELYEQANDLIQLMAVEVRSLESDDDNNDLKYELLHRMRAYKTQLQSLSNQHELFSMNSLTCNDSNQQQRQTTARTPIDNDETMLIRQNYRLENAHRTMVETETIAIQITEELHSNRGKLKATQEHLLEVKGLITDQASQLITKMSRKLWR